MALAAGIVVAVTFGNPWPERTRAAARSTLAWSVVGLGAGMNLAEVARAGLHGMGYTAGGIALALLGGTYLGRRLKVSRDTSLLITVGTAICGGSAIAAVAPAIGAKAHDVSIALAAVFVLNAVALYVFPAVGHALHLESRSFGLWCALAIHDTSSVIGAASQYGKEALQVATAAKLARALWIVPVTLTVTALRPRSGGAEERARANVTAPWFIGGFVAVAAIVTCVPWLHAAGAVVSTLAHRLLTTTLYLIGLGLSRGTLRTVGVRPLLQALVLWVALAAAALVAVVCAGAR
jgi:uncharacterized integral membrane protein (TIGR00698 family)